MNTVPGMHCPDGACTTPERGRGEGGWAYGGPSVSERGDRFAVFPESTSNDTLQNYVVFELSPEIQATRHSGFWILALPPPTVLVRPPALRGQGNE